MGTSCCWTKASTIDSIEEHTLLHRRILNLTTLLMKSRVPYCTDRIFHAVIEWTFHCLRREAKNQGGRLRVSDLELPGPYILSLAYALKRLEIYQFVHNRHILYVARR